MGINTKVTTTEAVVYYPRGIMSRTYKDRKLHQCYSSTPSWWTRITMNRPRRRENRMYESVVKFVAIENLIDYEPFLNWKKPHVYYW